LHQHQSRVIEKDLAGSRQHDAAGLALQQLCADLQFKVANLAAQGRLRRVQAPLGCIDKAALFRHRDEIAQMSKFHLDYLYF
jgi:hypothetical protein